MQLLLRSWREKFAKCCSKPASTWEMYSRSRYRVSDGKLLWNSVGLCSWMKSFHHWQRVPREFKLFHSFWLCTIPVDLEIYAAVFCYLGTIAFEESCRSSQEHLNKMFYYHTWRKVTCIWLPSHNVVMIMMDWKAMSVMHYSYLDGESKKFQYVLCYFFNNFQ